MTDVTQTVSLRPAGPDDCEQLADMYNACFPDVWQPVVFQSFFEQGNVVAFLAYDGQQEAGFFFGWAVTEHCDLLALAVLPAFRHRGIAQTLLDAARKDAVEKGAEKMFLEVGASNEAAHQLYLSAGFTVMGRRKDYYRRPDGTTEDAVTMECGLSA